MTIDSPTFSFADSKVFALFSTMCATGAIPFQRSHLVPTQSLTDELALILRSQSLPPPHICATLRAAVEQAPCELERYDSEIQRLEETPATLISERNELKAYTDGCRSVFSPVRRLPTELLVEIFDMCAPPSRGQHSSFEEAKGAEMDLVAKGYLLCLLSVCARWLKIVMETHSLWSEITVNSDYWDDGTKFALALQHSLDRGADFPLHLDIVVHPGDLNEGKILELLCQHSRRWRYLVLRIDPLSFGLLSDVKNNLPLLEDLLLWTDGGSPAYDDPAIFEIAPRLTTVSITGPVPKLPWEQVTFFRHDLHEAPFIDVVAVAPHLPPDATWELNVWPYDQIIPSQLPSTLSRIDSLSIGLKSTLNRDHADRLLAVLFGCLTLPHLDSLDIFCSRPLAPAWSQPAFSGLISRSLLGSTLERLQIHALIDEYDLLECLAALPSLKVLLLHDCVGDAEVGVAQHAIITNHILHGLTGTQLIPRLTSIHFFTVFRFEEELMRNFITSRIESRTADSHPELPPFELEISSRSQDECPLSSEFWEGLDQLEKDGCLVFWADEGPDVPSKNPDWADQD